MDNNIKANEIISNKIIEMMQPLKEEIINTISDKLINIRKKSDNIKSDIIVSILDDKQIEKIIINVMKQEKYNYIKEYNIKFQPTLRFKYFVLKIIFENNEYIVFLSYRKEHDVLEGFEDIFEFSINIYDKQIKKVSLIKSKKYNI